VTARADDQPDASPVASGSGASGASSGLSNISAGSGLAISFASPSSVRSSSAFSSPRFAGPFTVEPQSGASVRLAAEPPSGSQFSSGLSDDEDPPMPAFMPSFLHGGAATEMVFRTVSFAAPSAVFFRGVTTAGTPESTVWIPESVLELQRQLLPKDGAGPLSAPSFKIDDFLA
jgi:hypothetical protein